MSNVIKRFIIEIHQSFKDWKDLFSAEENKLNYKRITFFSKLSHGWLYYVNHPLNDLVRERKQKWTTSKSSQIKEIRNKYIMGNEIQIVEYLSKNQALIPILIEAEQKIKNVFIDGQLELKLIEKTKLGIFLITKLDADEAFDNLKVLDHTWWLNASCQINEKIEIYIDFS